MNAPTYRRLRRVAFISFAVALGMLPHSSGQATTRAGLDFRIQVTEGGETKEVTLDFGNHRFADGDTYLQTRRVSAKEGFVDFLFMKTSDFSPRYSGPEIDYSNVLETPAEEFYVDYYRLFRLKEGQTVSLRGRDIRVTLREVRGFGAPPPGSPPGDEADTQPTPTSGGIPAGGLGDSALRVSRPSQAPAPQQGGGVPQVWRVPDGIVSAPTSAPAPEPIVFPVQQQRTPDLQRYQPAPAPNGGGEPVGDAEPSP